MTKVHVCPKCGTGSFIIYEDSDEMFVTCTTMRCSFTMRIHIIPETTKKRDGE